MTVDELCDYLIVKTTEAGAALNLLKLQKLVYYCEAWHLAFFNRALSGATFQAWVHGPVNRHLYDRFKATKSLYSAVTAADVASDFAPHLLPLVERRHVDAILEVYGSFDGYQLEEMTHNERPWIEARGSCRPSERCERLLDPKTMADTYRERITT